MRFILTPVLFVCLYCSLYSVADAKNFYIPPDPSDRTQSIYFVFAASKSKSAVEAALYEINHGVKSKELSAFDGVEVKAAGYVIPHAHDLYDVAHQSPARSRLSRYIVAKLGPKEDPASVVVALAKHPDIQFAEVGTEVIAHGSSTDCGGTALIDRSSQFNELWALEEVRADEAWHLAEGHSLVGVIDYGVHEESQELAVFQSGQYAGGNYLKSLALDVGNRVSTSSGGPHPYQGDVVFGEADEYNAKVVNGYLDCDYDSDGYNQLRAGGHGTHVAGIIAGKGDSVSGWAGACKGCGLQVVRFTYATNCKVPPGQMPYSSMPYEADVALSMDSVGASLAFAVDVGSQIINWSGGVTSGWQSNHCDQYPNAYLCLALQYALDRDVMVFASSGNGAAQQQHWPAIDDRVYGVSGTQYSGGLWSSTANCGSNVGTDQTNGPSFSAPAKGVYSTMYPDINYSPSNCHEYNDGVYGDGYGYCIGTSMSAPMLSGIAGVVRSINPPALRGEVFEAIRQTTNRSISGQGYSSSLGWGTPLADFAVERMLGFSNGSRVVNRAIPLFALFSSVAGDTAYFTKPQVALAFSVHSVAQYTDDPTMPAVVGYDFSEASAHPVPPDARADIYLLSTQNSGGAAQLEPVFRMRYTGNWLGNPNNWDTTLVLEDEIDSFKSVGYEYEGRVGYIYSTCNRDCIPPSGVRVYRGYNASIDDHAVFPASRYSDMVTAGYSSIELMGYAYENADSDSDGVVDGMESLLGTDLTSFDSNCDGIADGEHYPPFQLPVSDPLSGQCGADLDVSLSASTNQFSVIIENLGNEDSDSSVVNLDIRSLTSLVYFRINVNNSFPSECTLLSASTCPPGIPNSCEINIQCNLGAIANSSSWAHTFSLLSNFPSTLEVDVNVRADGTVSDPISSNNQSSLEFPAEPLPGA